MSDRLTIPGIGTFRLTFDRICICSDVPKADLKRLLPVTDLEACSHAFRFEKRTGKRGSRIVLMCLPDRRVLTLLRQHEASLGNYDATRVEVACDKPVSSLAEAKRLRDRLIKRLDKINHKRGFITFIDGNAKGERLTPEQLERRGLVDEPTIYFEGKRAAHHLKLYIRREKLARGEHGPIVVRLEWTSTRSRAVKSHFGGNQLGNLLDADLTGYLHRFLALEEIDYTRLGKLIGRRHATHRQSSPRWNSSPAREHLRRQFDDDDYWAGRRAHLLIMVLEQHSWPKHANGEPIPEEVWRTSPAQIKGRFKAHFAKLRRKARPRRRNMLTMKKLEECFTPIPLRRVRIRLDE